VLCTNESGYKQLFRGTVVELEDTPDFDVILTAAHGLPRNVELLKEQCVVIDDDGRQYGLRRLWRPVDRGRGMADDWAVVATQRRMRRDQARLAVAAPIVRERRSLEARAAALRLPLMTVTEERDCTLQASGLTQREVERGLFSHSCRSWYGHSGSPLLAARDGRPVVIGFHLATRWFYEERRPIKIGRYVDAAIMAAIAAAARNDTYPDARAAR